MKRSTKALTYTLLSLSLFILGCTHAYASHHGNRAGRYNTIPYNGAYQYHNYRYGGGAYFGRPYRRF